MKKMVLGLLILTALLSGGTPAPRAAEETEPTGYVALTFDDGPSGAITRRLLKGLAERDARATFFLCGYRLEQYGDIAALITAGGHEIGLHGYSHDCMRSMDQRALEEELERTQALIRQQTGTDAVLLRPPGGCCGKTVARAAKEQGLAIILWSVDPRDWAVYDCACVAKSILDKTKDGDVILLHDMWDSSVDAALEAVDILQEKGYAFVTVSELAARKGITLQPGQQYSRIG